MKKVSIIIPVYNTSTFIEECLKSVISQIYSNLEIIIINDGSTDDSLKKILKYEKLDSRIKVINNKNHGVAYSRNVGIKQSTGEYLTFIDSDDIVSKNFIFKLVSNLESTNSDCSVCGIKSFYLKKEIISSKGTKEIYKSSNEMKKKLFHELNGFLANKMYKASIIKRNNYYLNEKIFVSEDLLFNLYYFDSCKKIVYDSSYCYFYRQHNTSAYNNLKNKKWFTVLDAYSLMLNKEKKNDQIYDEIIYNFGLTILEAKYRLDYLDYIAKEEKINLKLRLRKLEKMYVPFNRYIHLKFFLYKFFPKLIIFYKKRKMKG